MNLDISYFEVQGLPCETVVNELAGLIGGVEVKDQRGTCPTFDFRIPGEGTMDYPRFYRALDRVGYDGSVAVEISVFRQRLPGFDPVAAARKSFEY